MQRRNPHPKHQNPSHKKHPNPSLQKNPSSRRHSDRNKVFFEKQKKHLCSGGIPIKTTNTPPRKNTQIPPSKNNPSSRRHPTQNKVLKKTTPLPAVIPTEIKFFLRKKNIYAAEESPSKRPIPLPQKIPKSLPPKKIPPTLIQNKPPINYTSEKYSKKSQKQPNWQKIHPKPQ